jgi:hypothetical protein
MKNSEPSHPSGQPVTKKVYLSEFVKQPSGQDAK